MLMFVTADPLKNIASFGALIVAWSFVFGNSCRVTFECFVFLFMTNPYDVGTRPYNDRPRQFVSQKNQVIKYRIYKN
ncbi:Mechanosensitive ion channel protein 5 [Smittium culicis]|uniref:Mechanosensitive ion channel protein 5 n=1 Tax=Smittium culicis TaxID=133412 RepID=A0A1R1XJF5_9FUNG|nr:Mechanosensitive ion channel protein 5 [Smittium culicis]